MFDDFIIRTIDRIRFKYISLKCTCKQVVGQSFNLQPVLLVGHGKITFGLNVQLGYKPSPFLYTSYAHVEARHNTAEIIFGNNIFINNNFVIIAEKSTIEIEDNVLIGCNVQIFDSDFHAIHPEKRNSGAHHCKNVLIKNNVFIGNNVIILKGVTIGENTIVAAGSVVSQSFPANVIIGGNPAQIVKKIVNE